MKLKLIITALAVLFFCSAVSSKAETSSQKRDTTLTFIETDFEKILKKSASDYFKLGEVEAIANRDSNFNHDSSSKIVLNYSFPFIGVDYRLVEITKNFFNNATGKLNQKTTYRFSYGRHGEILWPATCVFYGLLGFFVLLEIKLFQWYRSYRSKKNWQGAWYALLGTLGRWVVMAIFILLIGDMVLSLSGTAVEFPMLWLFLCSVIATTIICAIYTKLKRNNSNTQTNISPEKKKVERDIIPGYLAKR